MKRRHSKVTNIGQNCQKKKKAEGAPLDWELVGDGGSKAGRGSAGGTQRNTRGDREGHTKGDFIRGGTPFERAAAIGGTNTKAGTPLRDHGCGETRQAGKFPLGAHVISIVWKDNVHLRKSFR